MNLRLAAIPAAILVVVACSSSSSTPAPDYSGSCTILASQCHGVGTPLADECHDLGHDGDDAKCGPRKAECLAVCPENHDGHDSGVEDGGADTPDATSDAPVEAAADPCATYCTCMKSTCASEPGYPFADDAACLTACKALSTEDFACVSKSCEDAKPKADKAHDCEHASGAVACH